MFALRSFSGPIGFFETETPGITVHILTFLLLEAVSFFESPADQRRTVAQRPQLARKLPSREKEPL